MHKLISSLLQAIGVTSAPTIPPDQLAAITDQRRPVGCQACEWSGYADYAAVPCEACGGRGLRPAPAPRGPVTQAVEAGRGPTCPETTPDRPRGANGPADERLTITDGPGHELSPPKWPVPVWDTLKRQEAAELLLCSMGWHWSGDKWKFPSDANPNAAIAYALDYGGANGEWRALEWLRAWQDGDPDTRYELAEAVNSGEISY